MIFFFEDDFFAPLLHHVFSARFFPAVSFSAPVLLRFRDVYRIRFRHVYRIFEL